MSATATSATTGTLEVGNLWMLSFEVRNPDLINATVSVVVTQPDGSTSVLSTSNPSTGIYEATYVLMAAGRHTATATISGTAVAVVSWSVDAEAVVPVPNTTEVRNYLGDGAAAWADFDIQNAISAEYKAQTRACRIGPRYTPDLSEALKRRVARNLGFRGIPLGVQPTGDGLGAIPIGSTDPEVRRLEAPYRRKPVG